MLTGGRGTNAVAGFVCAPDSVARAGSAATSRFSLCHASPQVVADIVVVPVLIPVRVSSRLNSVSSSSADFMVLTGCHTRLPIMRSPVLPLS